MGTAAAAIEEMETLFDDHPSLAGSIDDFDPDARSERSLHSPPAHAVFGIPSTHSGFRADMHCSDSSEIPQPTFAPTSSAPWRRSGTGFYSHRPPSTTGSSAQHMFSPSRSMSRETSPMHGTDEDPDITLAADVPLPASPLKRTPAPSMEPETRMPPSPSAEPEDQTAEEAENPLNNYFRFAIQAEVQQRTEPVERVVFYVRELYHKATGSWTSLLSSLFIALISIQLVRSLSQPPSQAPVPDLVKVADLAKSFEDLIIYSENGLNQISTLQESSMAVWDLGESVRAANITSGAIIAKELDELSDDLRLLGMDLTKFFSSVNGDVDSIIIVMDWAIRELSRVSSNPATTLTSVMDNMYNLFNRAGLLSDTHGAPTTVGVAVREVFGHTHSQLTRAALQRTFIEFLGVVEESISNELAFAAPLLAQFEAVDHKYGNLHRLVIRTHTQEENEAGEMLASLWARLVPGGKSRMRKFEKNHSLLASVRARTVRNKGVLVNHNARLLQLKERLESLRRQVVSPLVRSNDSSTLSIDQQIKGIEGPLEFLSKARDWQKERLRDMLSSAGQRIGNHLVHEGYEIDGKA